MDSMLHSTGELNDAKGLPHTFSPLSITQTLSDQNLGSLKSNIRPSLYIETCFSMDSADDFEEVFPMTFSVDNAEHHQYISPASSAPSICSNFSSSLEVSDDSMDDMFQKVSDAFQLQFLPRDAAVACTRISENVKLQSTFCCNLSSAGNRRKLFHQWSKRDIDNEGNRRHQDPQTLYKRNLALRATCDILHDLSP